MTLISSIVKTSVYFVTDEEEKGATRGNKEIGNNIRTTKIIIWLINKISGSKIPMSQDFDF